MTVYAITDTKKGEQGLCLLIFKLPKTFVYLFTYLVQREIRQSTVTTTQVTIQVTTQKFEVCKNITISREQECYFQFADWRQKTGAVDSHLVILQTQSELDREEIALKSHDTQDTNAMAHPIQYHIRYDTIR